MSLIRKVLRRKLNRHIVTGRGPVNAARISAIIARRAYKESEGKNMKLDYFNSPSHEITRVVNAHNEAKRQDEIASGIFQQEKRRPKGKGRVSLAIGKALISKEPSRNVKRVVRTVRKYNRPHPVK